MAKRLLPGQPEPGLALTKLPPHLWVRVPSEGLQGQAGLSSGDCPGVTDLEGVYPTAPPPVRGSSLVMPFITVELRRLMGGEVRRPTKDVWPWRAARSEAQRFSDSRLQAACPHGTGLRALLSGAARGPGRGTHHAHADSEPRPRPGPRTGGAGSASANLTFVFMFCLLVLFDALTSLWLTDAICHSNGTCTVALA